MTLCRNSVNSTLRDRTKGILQVTLSISYADTWWIISLIAAVLLIAISVFYYRKTDPPLSAPLRVLLTALRIAAFALILFSIAEPVISMIRDRMTPPRYAVLLDDSESVKSVDGVESALALEERMVSALAGISDAEFTLYQFSDSARLAERVPDLDGQQTAIGDCISQIAGEREDEDLRGIIVVSDGIANSGRDPIDVARRIGIPVHTLDLGRQKTAKDIRIARIQHDEIGYENKETEIEIELESRGFKDVTVPVRVRKGEGNLAREDVRVASDGSRQVIRLKFTPTERGLQTFSVSLPVQTDESLTDNNERKFSMRIMKSKHRVLLAAGYPSWELSFLKRTIEHLEDFELDLHIYDRTGNLRSAEFPPDADRLGEYDLLILLDYSPSAIGNRIETLATFLRDQSKSLLVVLGENMSGGIPAEFEEMIPFEFSGALRYDESRPFNLTLTESGKYHPVLQVSDEIGKLQEIWSSLPPFSGLVSNASQKEGTSVLAVHPTLRNREELVPIIAAGSYGQGRVLGINAAPLWKARFLDIGRGGEGIEYSRLIENALRWLVTSKELDRIYVTPDRQIFKSGERVTFSASLLDDSYKAIDDAAVTIRVHGDSSSVEDTLAVSMVRSGKGKMTADLHLLKDGVYHYTAEVVRFDETIATLEGNFEVEKFSLERDALFSRDDVLRELAAASGGIYAPIADYDSLLASLDLSETVVFDKSEISLANNWILLAVLLILLSCEWAIRKRYQLM